MFLAYNGSLTPRSDVPVVAYQSRKLRINVAELGSTLLATVFGHYNVYAAGSAHGGELIAHGGELIEFVTQQATE
jgi:hypothetical protein